MRENSTIALALIALITTLVGIVGWAVRYAMKEIVLALRQHSKAAIKQSETNNLVASKIEASQKVDEELLTFMQHLNGKLKEAVHEKQNKVKSK